MNNNTHIKMLLKEYKYIIKIRVKKMILILLFIVKHMKDSLSY